MESLDLALYTTQELIEELTRRTTFLGVVVHSGVEFKNGTWDEEMPFSVRFNTNLSQAEAGRLLGTVGRYLDEACAEES